MSPPRYILDDGGPVYSKATKPTAAAPTQRDAQPGQVGSKLTVVSKDDQVPAEGKIDTLWNATYLSLMTQVQGPDGKPLDSQTYADMTEVLWPAFQKKQTGNFKGDPVSGMDPKSIPNGTEFTVPDMKGLIRQNSALLSKYKDQFDTTGATGVATPTQVDSSPLVFPQNSAPFSTVQLAETVLPAGASNADRSTAYAAVAKFADAHPDPINADANGNFPQAAYDGAYAAVKAAFPNDPSKIQMPTAANQKIIQMANSVMEQGVATPPGDITKSAATYAAARDYSQTLRLGNSGTLPSDASIRLGLAQSFDKINKDKGVDTTGTYSAQVVGIVDKAMPPGTDQATQRAAYATIDDAIKKSTANGIALTDSDYQQILQNAVSQAQGAKVTGLSAPKDLTDTFLNAYGGPSGALFQAHPELADHQAIITSVLQTNDKDGVTKLEALKTALDSNQGVSAAEASFNSWVQTQQSPTDHTLHGFSVEGVAGTAQKALLAKGMDPTTASQLSGKYATDLNNLLVLEAVKLAPGTNVSTLLPQQQALVAQDQLALAA